MPSVKIYCYVVMNKYRGLASNLVIEHLLVNCGFFPWGRHYTHLLTPGRELIADQSTDTTRVQLDEAVSLIGVT